VLEHNPRHKLVANWREAARTDVTEAAGLLFDLARIQTATCARTGGLRAPGGSGAAGRESKTCLPHAYLIR